MPLTESSREGTSRTTRSRATDYHGAAGNQEHGLPTIMWTHMPGERRVLRGRSDGGTDGPNLSSWVRFDSAKFFVRTDRSRDQKQSTRGSHLRRIVVLALVDTAGRLPKREHPALPFGYRASTQKEYLRGESIRHNSTDFPVPLAVPPGVRTKTPFRLLWGLSSSSITADDLSR